MVHQSRGQGYPRALTNLGYCYEEGQGVYKNEVKAVELYTKAALSGYAQAQTNLAYCYENGDWRATRLRQSRGMVH